MTSKLTIYVDLTFPSYAKRNPKDGRQTVSRPYLHATCEYLLVTDTICDLFPAIMDRKQTRPDKLFVFPARLING